MTETPVNMNIANRTLTMFFNQEQPVHNAMLAELSQSGTYERATQLFLCKVLRRGDTFVDVGAHIGYFSMLAAAVVGESDKVVSVEPTDENFAHLQRHIDENNLTYVSSVKSVISGTDGDVHVPYQQRQRWWTCLVGAWIAPAERKDPSRPSVTHITFNDAGQFTRKKRVRACSSHEDRYRGCRKYDS